MINKLFLPPSMEHIKIPGTVNNTPIVGTDHFHLRYFGAGPPSLDWSELFGYGSAPTLPVNPKQVTEAADELSDKYIVLLSHGGVEESFWCEYFKGAFMSAKKQGTTLKVRYPKDYGNIANQLMLLDKSINEKPYAIATTIPVPKLFLPRLREAQNNGIRIISIGAKTIVKGKKTSLPFLSNGIDNYRTGQLIAYSALKSGKIKKSIVLVSRVEGSVGSDMYFQGIQSIFNKQNILVDKIIINSKSDQKLLTSYIEKNNSSGLILLRGNLLEWLPKNLFTSSTYICVIDKTPLSTNLLQRGEIDTVLDERPFIQGYLSISLPLKSRILKPNILFAPKMVATQKTIQQQKKALNSYIPAHS